MTIVHLYVSMAMRPVRYAGAVQSPGSLSNSMGHLQGCSVTAERSVVGGISLCSSTLNIEQAGCSIW